MPFRTIAPGSAEGLKRHAFGNTNSHFWNDAKCYGRTNSPNDPPAEPGAKWFARTQPVLEQ
jgi:hypothetical protein